MLHRLALIALLTSAAATAQTSSWSPPLPPGTSVSLNATKAAFDGRFEGPHFATSAWFLESSFPVGPSVRIVGDLPFAYASYTDIPEDESGAAVGNLRLGVEVDVRPNVALGVDVRLPTASEGEMDATANALSYASLATFDRVGAFTPNALSVGGLAEANFEPASTPALSFRLRAQPLVLVPVGDNDLGGLDETEGVLTYAAQTLYDLGPARLGAGVSGVEFLTDDSDHILYVGALADAQVGAVRPGLSVRLPVSGDIDSFVNGAVTVGVTYAFD